MDDLILQIIHDSRRFERLDPLKGEMLQQGIAYVIWDAVVKPGIAASINASHKMIVRWAQEQELPEVAIAEDDVMFPSPDGWLWFLSNRPEKFDIYWGGRYNGTGAHLYIVDSRFYDRFLSVPDDVHIDVAIAAIGDCHTCYPYAAIQREGFSANNNKIVNYNTMLTKQDVYGW